MLLWVGKMSDLDKKSDTYANELTLLKSELDIIHCYFCKMDADTIDDGPGSPRVALGCDTQPPNHSWRQAKRGRSAVM